MTPARESAAGRAFPAKRAAKVSVCGHCENIACAADASFERIATLA